MTKQQSQTNIGTDLTNLHWPLILALGAVALVRPFLSILGISGVSILATVLITVVWVGTVVIRRIQHPILTLTAAGGMYGVYVIIMMLVGDPSRVAQLGYAGSSIVITNLVWGGISGLIAAGIHRIVD